MLVGGDVERSDRNLQFTKFKFLTKELIFLNDPHWVVGFFLSLFKSKVYIRGLTNFRMATLISTTLI